MLGSVHASHGALYGDTLGLPLSASQARSMGATFGSTPWLIPREDRAASGQDYNLATLLRFRNTDADSAGIAGCVCPPGLDAEDDQRCLDGDGTGVGPGGTPVTVGDACPGGCSKALNGSSWGLPPLSIRFLSGKDAHYSPRDMMEGAPFEVSKASDQDLYPEALQMTKPAAPPHPPMRNQKHIYPPGPSLTLFILICISFAANAGRVQAG